MTMEVVDVLHMNGGMGENSYAMNSMLQQKVISMTKPITEEAITQLYTSTFPTTISIADLGCSSGPNTLFTVTEIITAVDALSNKLSRPSPEFQVFLNDLPGNDFNTIFRSLFQKLLNKHRTPLFINGVPGSFYGRLFLSNSIHFVHSSYSLQWLSQVPEGVEEDNVGNIYMADSSPPKVLEAYYGQFQKDFGMFLRCRGEELVNGGRMVLTFLGRRSDDPCSKECCFIWELMSIALNEMASEGLVDNDKLNKFNIPQYTPSAMEVEAEVKREGSFVVDRIAVSKVRWDAYDELKDGGYTVANCMRAVAEPLLIGQFGEGGINVDEVFRRYRAIVTERMANEKTEFVNVTVSLIRDA
ncbi:Salicylate carboxymethyltransferase [Linum perenne]